MHFVVCLSSCGINLTGLGDFLAPLYTFAIDLTFIYPTLHLKSPKHHPQVLDQILGFGFGLPNVSIQGEDNDAGFSSFMPTAASCDYARSTDKGRSCSTIEMAKSDQGDLKLELRDPDVMS